MSPHNFFRHKKWSVKNSLEKIVLNRKSLINVLIILQNEDFRKNIISHWIRRPIMFLEVDLMKKNWVKLKMIRKMIIIRGMKSLKSREIIGKVLEPSADWGRLRMIKMMSSKKKVHQKMMCKMKMMNKLK